MFDVMSIQDVVASCGFVLSFAAGLLVGLLS
jgi:hypothetical protein